MNKYRILLWCVVVMLAVAMIGCRPEATPAPSSTTVGSPPSQSAVPGTLTTWKFYDARDPHQSDLITSEGDSFALDPNWPIKSIDYVYKWWGLAEPVFDRQTIARDGEVFRKGDQSISAENVAAFLKSIDHLYPTQLLVGGNAWTDDYPSWMIEITGADGRRALLYSSSTGNVGDGPWNVLYNGRLYAQYDGSLAAPLSKLFQSKRGEPAAVYFPGGRMPDAVVYSTLGRPTQLIYGFNGLLPIADGFRYRTNVVSGTLEGFVEGRSSIGGYGHMVIGTINGLKRVALTMPDQSTIECVIEPIETQDVAGAVWQFACKPAGTTVGAAYRYPIVIELSTDKGEVVKTDGELFGSWGNDADVLLVPPPAEMQVALSAHEAARDLLSDHVVAYALYQAAISTTSPFSGTLVGEAVLLGQTKIDAGVARYMIGTPFVIENGKLTRWDLTRAALEQLLQDVSRQPLTQRVMTAVPTATLNLWYADTGNTPKMAPTISGWPTNYAAKINACGDIQASVVPTTGKPLRAFGFNSGWSFRQADFMLIDGKPVVSDLDLMPYRDDRGGVLSLLIPPQFDTGDVPPFARIWLQSSSYSGDRPTLTLWIPEKASAAALEKYNQIADALPVKVDKKYDTLWEAEGMTFVVTDDGKLEVKACR